VFQTGPAGVTPSAPTTALTINAGGAIGVGSSNTIGASGTVLTSAGSTAPPTWSSIVNSITAGTGISITGGSGSSPYTGAITIASTATTSSVLGTANQIDASTVSGVTTLSLDSALIAPGSVVVTTNLTIDGFTYESSATNITAAGTTQGTATALTKSYNVVTTAAAGTGVLLPASGIGLEITIVNASTNSILVYAAGSDVIDSEQSGSNTSV